MLDENLIGVNYTEITLLYDSVSEHHYPLTRWILDERENIHKSNPDKLYLDMLSKTLDNNCLALNIKIGTSANNILSLPV